MNLDLEQKETAKTAKARITGMVAIRDCVRELIRLQMEETEDADTKISAEQVRLNTLYDSYTAKWGLLNSTAEQKGFLGRFLLSSVMFFRGIR